MSSLLVFVIATSLRNCQLVYSGGRAAAAEKGWNWWQYVGNHCCIMSSLLVYNLLAAVSSLRNLQLLHPGGRAAGCREGVELVAAEERNLCRNAVSTHLPCDAQQQGGRPPGPLTSLTPPTTFVQHKKNALFWTQNDLRAIEHSEMLLKRFEKARSHAMLTCRYTPHTFCIGP